MRMLFRLFPLAVLPAVLIPPAVDANPVWPGFFELTDRAYSLNIPPDGSVWASLISSDEVNVDSTTVITVEQATFDDNDDGVVSAGDWVLGPPEGEGRGAILIVFASRLYRLEENDWVLKPVLEDGGSPVGETWEFVLPGYLLGDTVLVEGWTGSGEPADGDGIQLDGVWYTIRSVGLVVEGDFAVPVKPTSWGRIKAWLADIF